MLSTSPSSAVELLFNGGDWDSTPQIPPKLYQPATTFNSWGVTSIGRGYNWNERGEQGKGKDPPTHSIPVEAGCVAKEFVAEPEAMEPQTSVHERKHHSSTPIILYKPLIMTPPASPRDILAPWRPTTPVIQPLARSPSSPRPRRRSSQQRVSLIAGQVSIAPIEPPSPPPGLSDTLRRTPSNRSFLSQAESTRPPTPSLEQTTFLGERNISEYLIDGEIGRGAYGLVKRAREFNEDGTLGPPLVIKQVIKSRILADCWKKHPKLGTIPIEIYVMSAISNTSYMLPPRRPWSPSRFTRLDQKNSQWNEVLPEGVEDDWIEGKIIKGHPNICPLLDFFEDNHYYYLVLPSSTPERLSNEPSSPSDLFDLVETYPQGLPPSRIRTYLGQIADAVAFLHSHGIVHRDIKDENVVLGKHGKCILIDFGSSGLVKKSGWDTFSGTLDYAGPEILRGERYYGKEQDVWAYGVVAYVLLVGECPFMTAAEAQEGLESPFAGAAIALDERCGDETENENENENEGKEPDGGGGLSDAASLVRACLQVEVSERPTFERILQSRFLVGHGGWI